MRARLCLYWGIAYSLMCVSVPVCAISGCEGKRDERRELQSIKNMKILQMALQTYHDTYRRMPPAYTVDAQGNRLHSWRVLVLPYLDQRELYSKIRLDEPWNSNHNRKLLASRPSVFSANDSDTSTDYLAVVGSSTIWPRAMPESHKKWTAPMKDTLLLVEYMGSTIPWMEPRDATIDGDDEPDILVDDDRIQKCLLGNGHVLSATEPRAKLILQNLNKPKASEDLSK